MTVRCDACGHRFVNDLELDQHDAMVHARKWRGRATFSESGDEQADGAVPPTTADTLHPRPDARERARSFQE